MSSDPIECQNTLPFNLPNDILRNYLLKNYFDDKELIKVCNTCQRSRAICNEDTFWRDRLGLTTEQLNMINQYRNYRRWSTYYIEDLSLLINTPKTMLLEGARNGRLDYVIIALNMKDTPERNSPERNRPSIDQNYGGYTALMSASMNGKLDIVKYLVDKGADINLQDNYGYTALMWASRDGHLDIVKYLVDNVANINLQSNYGATALMFASEHGKLDIVKYLADNGANIDLQNNDGLTALTLASRRYGHLDIVKYLENL